MAWPQQFLTVVLSLGAAAVFLPWLLPRDRRIAGLAFVPALVALAAWGAYEAQLLSLARPGDPLIRVDLLLILPLLVLAGVSATTALVVKSLRPAPVKPAAERRR